MENFFEPPILASDLVREAMTRLFSPVPRGLTKEQRAALSEYEGPIQSSHPSGEKG